jgi:hypothetical protein
MLKLADGVVVPLKCFLYYSVGVSLGIRFPVHTPSVALAIRGNLEEIYSNRNSPSLNGVFSA